ncbi:hypothetical protein KFK09_007845 [Dendrobium nobile]|uniref:Uncharacterized protein n=1 Tax=Dendrobium nobile TaxID=94219 RepID=A0A8T3BXZ6_DENNO|nr:hypothetical protein KFK09_007845 [Dendrobium nobile]
MWIRYFDKFFNEIYENMIDFSDLSTLNNFFYFYRRINKTEVGELSKKMECGKAV